MDQKTGISWLYDEAFRGYGAEIRLYCPDFRFNSAYKPTSRKGRPLSIAFGRRVHPRELFDMTKPNCDICGKPATVHETVREAGEVTSRRFCQEHGELRVIEEYYRRSLSEAEWEPIARLYRPTDLGT
jgi:hypothetical protein